MKNGEEYVLTLSAARKVVKMLNGESVSRSMLAKSLAEELLEEGLLIQTSRGSRGSYRIQDVEGCRIFMAQRYDIHGSLEAWVEILSRQEGVSRGRQVTATGNSKARKVRSFKGFPVNSYTRIEATLRGEAFTIQPVEGTSLYIEDYEHFRIPENVVVVGMENGENFQHIRRQEYLFRGMDVLFVSRYPQSTDLRTWLQMIPNRYLHFGDFDLAGIHIFLNEFYAFLGERAEFFVPADVEERLMHGNRRLYDLQYARYRHMEVADRRLLPLIEMIHRYEKGYEQEGYIIE